MPEGSTYRVRRNFFFTLFSFRGARLQQDVFLSEAMRLVCENLMKIMRIRALTIFSFLPKNEASNGEILSLPRKNTTTQSVVPPPEKPGRFYLFHTQTLRRKASCHLRSPGPRWKMAEQVPSFASKYVKYDKFHPSLSRTNCYAAASSEYVFTHRANHRRAQRHGYCALLFFTLSTVSE